MSVLPLHVRINALAGLSQWRVLRRVLGRPYFLVNAWIWKQFAARHESWAFVRAYGTHLHLLSQMRMPGVQSTTTYFFRNRPALALLLQLLDQTPIGSTVNLAVAGCSTGAEVYSISYVVRCARPDLTLNISAFDISEEVLQIAEAATYPLGDDDNSQTGGVGSSRDQPSPIVERMSCREMELLFDREDDHVRIKSPFRQGIAWRLGDAGDPRFIDAVGVQDFVVANNFLCHMRPGEAEACLRALGRLTKPCGYLFVSGVDLDMRSKVARELGWSPVTKLIGDIHEGDESLRRGWPLEYWGLEPFDRRRKDCQLRYASVFQMSPESRFTEE